MDFSPIGPFLIAALVIFAVYRRLRRSFGQQLLRPTRMSIRMGLLVVLACTLLPAAMRSAPFLSAELVGATVGISMAAWGAQRTRFEMHAGRLHYVPHTYTGIAVTLLFLGRLTYRLVQVYSSSHAANAADPSQALAPAAMVKSPMTLGIFFVLAGYYVCYYGWLLWKSKHLNSGDLEIAPVATTS